jgi:hypothetical protein
MRLIDADAVREVHCASCSEAIRSGCENDPVCASLLWIDEAPTIDAVPVVRCKNCKHSGKHEAIFFPGHIICGLRMQAAPVKPDDFCSNGERRANNVGV